MANDNAIFQVVKKDKIWGQYFTYYYIYSLGAIYELLTPTCMILAKLPNLLTNWICNFWIRIGFEGRCRRALSWNQLCPLAGMVNTYLQLRRFLQVLAPSTVFTTKQTLPSYKGPNQNNSSKMLIFSVRKNSSKHRKF